MNLHSPVTDLKGIGEKTAVPFAKAGIHTVQDLIEYYPRAYELFEEPTEPEEMEEMEESPIEEPKKDVEGNVFNYGRKEVLLVAWGYFRRHYFSTFAESLRVAWGEFKAGKKCFLIELRDRIKAKRKPIVEKMVDSGINTFKNLPGSYKMRIDYSADWFAPKYQALFNIL